MILKEIFEQHNVPLWGICSLEAVSEEAKGYRCIAFALPYDSNAISALPNDELIDRSRKDLSGKTKVIYAKVQNEFGERCFLSYDEMDGKFRLRERKVSQKVLGHLAGLGWIGKSSLLISLDFGPRIRLGTIFTKNEMGATSKTCDGSCGSCTACLEVCPVGAITQYGYDVDKCRKVVTDSKGDYKTFCGLCMKACPQGNANNAMHMDVDSASLYPRR